MSPAQSEGDFGMETAGAAFPMNFQYFAIRLASTARLGWECLVLATQESWRASLHSLATSTCLFVSEIGMRATEVTSSWVIQI